MEVYHALHGRMAEKDRENWLLLAFKGRVESEETTLLPLRPYCIPNVESSTGREEIQGDPSGSSKPPVDIKMNVAFQYMLLIVALY